MDKHRSDPFAQSFERLAGKMPVPEGDASEVETQAIRRMRHRRRNLVVVTAAVMVLIGATALSVSTRSAQTIEVAAGGAATDTTGGSIPATSPTTDPPSATASTVVTWPPTTQSPPQSGPEGSSSPPVLATYVPDPSGVGPQAYFEGPLVVDSTGCLRFDNEDWLVLLPATTQTISIDPLVLELPTGVSLRADGSSSRISGGVMSLASAMTGLGADAGACASDQVLIVTAVSE